MNKVSSIQQVTEEEMTRLTVEALANDLELAVEKLQFLTESLNDNYLEVETEFDDLKFYEMKQREMFLINAMVQDYLEDIREIKDTMEAEFDL